MKAIIENKVYDTKTAESIADWENMQDWGDFRYLTETLYRTKKGVFFLHAEGGPMSRVACIAGSTATSGAEIAPLTPAEALAWCCRTKNNETALKYFSASLTEA